MLNFFFGFHGRIRRSSYFFGALAAMCLWTVLCVSSIAALAVANGAVVDGGAHGPVIGDDVNIEGGPWVGLGLAVLGLIGLWSSAALTVKRWHDVGMSGWFALLTLPPFANFMMFVLLCLLPGTIGPNPYGRDPRGRSGPVHAEPALA